MKTAAEAVLDYLDGVTYAMNATGLIQELPDYSVDELKEALTTLHKAGRLQRVSVKSANGKIFYTYYSLFVRTVEGYNPAPEPAPVNGILNEDQASRLMERLQQDLHSTKAPEPEIREVVREVVKYHAAKFGIMDVIDRWKLNFRLSRIIEIVGSARNRKLTKEDADIVSRLIQQHVKEAANG